MMAATFRKSARLLLGALPAPAAAATVATVGGLVRRLTGRKSLSLHPAVRARSFGAHGSHCFFGYYDITPFDRRGRRLLAGRRDAGLGPLAAGTPLEVGTFDLSRPDVGFEPFGRTMTWCWQQGARLQWLEAFGPDCVIYNRRVDGAHGAVIQDAATGAVIREIEAPVYAVRPDGRGAVSLNFARLQRLRPGYGYDDLPDATLGSLAPADDGLWSVDLKTGERTFLFSLADAAALDPQPSMREAEHYFNHVSWSPSGARFLVFHLWQVGSHRFRRALTLDANGKAPFLLTNETEVSHYCWFDDRTVLLTSTHVDTGPGFHIYRDGEGRIASWPRQSLPLDGHPSLSPKGQWLLCDTLPDLYRERTLFLYDVEAHTRIDIGAFHTPPALKGERRCDLHPRWSPDGRMVCVDVSHTGIRAMMTLDISELVGAGRA